MEKYNKKELEILILEENKSYSFIGKLYGVSGNAIKKAAKKLGIQLPSRRIVNENENFSHEGFKGNSFVNKLSDEEFTKIINNSKTWKEIGEKLGYKNGYCSLEVKDSFNDSKNWQSARSSIQKIARKIYFKNTKEPKCAICGYSKHVEVAHIKAVSEFDNDATIKEINSLSNLIGLCPNHHWEYDNGMLKI